VTTCTQTLLVADKPVLRQDKDAFVGGDLEVSDEIIVNCAPLV